MRVRPERHGHGQGLQADRLRKHQGAGREHDGFRGDQRGRRSVRRCHGRGPRLYKYRGDMPGACHVPLHRRAGHGVLARLPGCVVGRGRRVRAGRLDARHRQHGIRGECDDPRPGRLQPAVPSLRRPVRRGAHGQLGRYGERAAAQPRPRRGVRSTRHLEQRVGNGQVHGRHLGKRIGVLPRPVGEQDHGGLHGTRRLHGQDDDPQQRQHRDGKRHDRLLRPRAGVLLP